VALPQPVPAHITGANALYHIVAPFLAIFASEHTRCIVYLARTAEERTIGPISLCSCGCGTMEDNIGKGMIVDSPVHGRFQPPNAAVEILL